MLRLSYAHVQLYLYRPFLHYLKTSTRENQSLGSYEKTSAYAAACITTCHEIIHFSYDICRRGHLFGAYWNVTHMIFGSILALMYMVLDSRNEKGMDAIFKDIAIGRKVLVLLARYGIAAARGKTMLTVSATSLCRCQGPQYANGAAKDNDRPSSYGSQEFS
jgi:hypothetical protein